MNKNKLFILCFLSLFLTSCGINHKKNEGNKRCPVMLQSGKFKRVLVEQHVILVEGDSIKFNEMKFECTNSAFTTQKIMYDNFGMWDKATFVEDSNIPILIWKDTNLFSNGQLFTVMATGDENFETIYGSVIILDKEKNDFLDSNTASEEVSEYFEKLIKKIDWQDKKFINSFNNLRESNKTFIERN